MKDLINHLGVPVNAFTSANIKATTAGASISVVGYESLAFAVFVGVLGDTLSGSTSYEVDIQESFDAGSTWSAAADINVEYPVTIAGGAANVGAVALLASGSLGAAAQTLWVGYLGIAANVRLNVVVKGTMTNGTVLSAIAVPGNPRHQPASITQAP